MSSDQIQRRTRIELSACESLTECAHHCVLFPFQQEHLQTWVRLRGFCSSLEMAAQSFNRIDWI